jgi:hypothetical protein
VPVLRVSFIKLLELLRPLWLVLAVSDDLLDTASAFRKRLASASRGDRVKRL